MKMTRGQKIVKMLEKEMKRVIWKGKSWIRNEKVKGNCGKVGEEEK